MGEEKFNDIECSYHLLLSDFQKIFDMYLQTMKERNSAITWSISFFSAPFVILTSLLAAKVIDPISISGKTIDLPSYIYWFVVICSLGNLLPLFKFIETTCMHMRAARLINNFRRYYCKILKEDFQRIQWSTNLPTDPLYPPSFSARDWYGWYILFISIVNATYFVVGIYGLENRTPISISGIIIFIVFIFAQLIYYFFRSGGHKKFHKKPLEDTDTGFIDL